MSKFVYAKVDLAIQNGERIEKNAVGIIEEERNNNYSILFIRVGETFTVSKKYVELLEFNETGDAYPKKVCNVCAKLLDTSQFAKNQNAKGDRSVRRPSCKSCRKVIDGVKVKASVKRAWEESKPHLVPFECPVCGKRTIPGLTSKIVLDHDHTNGSVRGWICDSCNTGLGRFKDDVEILKKAINYLEEKAAE